MHIDNKNFQEGGKNHVLDFGAFCHITPNAWVCIICAAMAKREKEGKMIKKAIIVLTGALILNFVLPFVGQSLFGLNQAIQLLNELVSMMAYGAIIALALACVFKSIGYDQQIKPLRRHGKLKGGEK